VPRLTRRGKAQLMMAGVSFDPDWSGPAEWARMYRAVGLQVVPARFPMKTRDDKRPALADWREFQREQVEDAIFEKWFSSDAKPNMGAITGAASGNLLVIDLDEYKSPEAALWFREAMFGVSPETWMQITGGGGRQWFFRLPADVAIGNCRTALGVDIRGQGGFAMLPPSRHMSGKPYAWADGHEPWSIDIDVAPTHLIDAVRALIEEHGGSATPAARERVASEQDHDAWGHLVDGREEYMRAVVWARVVDMRRESPARPAGEALEAHIAEAYQVYERKVRSRLGGPDPLAIKLDREGRGFTAFADKFRAALKQWDGKVAEAALVPKLVQHDEPPSSSTSGASLAEKVEAANGAAAAGDIYEWLDIASVKRLPDPRWAVKDLIIEDALGFIYGAPGVGKSFVALNLALSVAYGYPSWWWSKAIERKGPVVYITSEGTGTFKVRIDAWQRHEATANGVELDDAAQFALVRETINFMKAEDVAKLIRTVEAVQAAMGGPPALVFVDTVSRVIPGADENLQSAMTLFVEACDQVRKRFGCSVVGVHHAGKAGDMRGSTVLKGAGDFVFKLEREDEDDHTAPFKFIAEKIKDAADGWRNMVKLSPVGWIEAGKLDGERKSLVALPTTAESPIRKPDDMPSRDIVRQVLKDIDASWSAGNPLSPKVQTKSIGRYAPQVASTRYGVKIEAAERLIQSLLDNEIIVFEQVNSNSKKFGLRVKSWEI